MKSIVVEGLSFSYENDTRLILQNISFTVQEGEFVCLLGQSGCGKSTFLRLLAGLEHPTEGRILMDGKPITGPGLDRGVVFQDYGLFPWMTAGENIVLALRKKLRKENPAITKKELKDRALKLLDSVGLPETVYNTLPKELSGGMKQRCAIARSFGIDPPVLLMDEPFGALDAVTRALLQDLVLELWAAHEPKKTVFFVTHDVDEALLLANRIILLGQSPSHVIYECRIPPEQRPTRETQFEDVNVMKLRNVLMNHLHKDIAARRDILARKD